MQTYHLRPHHGLCLQYFRGHGYNQEFINNMQKIIAILKQNPDIQLVNHTDDICLTCPNCISLIQNTTEIDTIERIDAINHLHINHCTFNKKVLHYDNCVMELCDLTYNSILPWNEFNKLVHDNILAQNLRQTICGDCEWNNLCHEQSL